jgi:biotin carboxyl carrier protein
MLAADEFADASHSTSWVDEQLDLSALAATAPGGDVRTDHGHRVVAEIDGRRFDVTVWGDVLPLIADRTAATRVPPSPPVVEAGAPMLLTHIPGAVVAPLQGVVLKVLIAEGQRVAAGDAVCLLESMKMENTVTSDWSGVVREIRVGDGEMVAPGDVLAVIE